MRSDKLPPDFGWLIDALRISQPCSNPYDFRLTTSDFRGVKRMLRAFQPLLWEVRPSGASRFSAARQLCASDSWQIGAELYSVVWQVSASDSWQIGVALYSTARK